MPWRVAGEEVSEPAAYQLKVGWQRCLCLAHKPGTVESDLDASASVTV